jgi:glycosidase
MDNGPIIDVYSDHIFGDLEQPQNAAIWLRKKGLGVYHGNRKMPLNPRPEDTVRLSVTTGSQKPLDRVLLWYSTDDWQTHRLENFTKSELAWDTALWSYLQKWQISIPRQEESLMMHYKIGAEIQGSSSLVFADNQSDSMEKATNFSIWYSNDILPEWAKTAIVYQIFVDRFNPGKEKNWLQTSDLKKPFGGTLKGITEKLTWIKSMGFNAVWLTPIFASPSHHGYDTVDYFSINPRVGNLRDFLTLLEKAHQQNLRIILDFVANHCSNQHPFFMDALNSADSVYHDWFEWKKWPDYEKFYNVKRMPKLNLKFGQPARKHLLEAAQYWLRMGVDGFRLDYANGPEQDFWVDFRRTCHQIREDVWTFGEVVAPADVQASYAGSMNGTLDFLLSRALRLTFALREWNLSKFAGFMQAHFSYFPQDFSLPAFIDNHDMNRFIFSAKENKKALKLALLTLYLLPNPPIIYYGTESLLSQKKSIHAKDARGFDETRCAMNWDFSEEEDITGYLSKLAEIRVKYATLLKTPWQVHQIDDQRGILVLRKKDRASVFLVLNRSTNTVNLELTESENCGYRDLLSNQGYPKENNTVLLVEVPAESGKLLVSFDAD